MQRFFLLFLTFAGLSFIISGATEKPSEKDENCAANTLPKKEITEKEREPRKMIKLY